MKLNIYALVEDGLVTNTIVSTYGYVSTMEGNWIELSSDNKASRGYSLMGEKFVPEKPFKDWILDGIIWKAPKPEPELQADEVAEWDEKKGDWVKFKRHEKANSLDTKNNNSIKTEK